jgi:hypothetical protein
MMEQTTYVALENFKKTGIHYALFQMNMVFFKVITLNDIRSLSW